SELRACVARPCGAGGAAAEPRLKASCLEIDVVVHDEHVLARKLVEGGGSRDRGAGLFHVGLGLQQCELGLADTDVAEPPTELRLERATVPPRKLVDDHPAALVPAA